MSEPAVCVGVRVRELADTCWIAGTALGNCPGKRRCQRLWRAGGESGCVELSTHSDCVCNETTGLYSRLLQRVPTPSGWGLDKLRKAAAKWTVALKQKGDYGRWSHARVIAGYESAKARKYEAASRSLDIDPVSRGDARARAFVKADKTDFSMKIPDPRMILTRDPRYTLELASFLKPIEGAIYRVKMSSCRGLAPTRKIAKGRSGTERCRDIRAKWDQFTDPVAVAIDAARFDAHVSGGTLGIEHSVYRSVQPDPLLRLLLSWQFNTVGVTAQGIRFGLGDKRCTGDFNTGVGNSLLMALFCQVFIDDVKIRGDYYLDGDNSLLIFERTNLSIVLERLTPVFLEFGQEVTIDGVYEAFDDIMFCRQRMVEIAGVPKFVRYWTSVLQGFTVSHKHYREPKGGLKMLKLIVTGEAIMNKGVPIVGPIMNDLLAQLKHIKLPRFEQASGSLTLLMLESGLGAKRIVQSYQPEVGVTNQTRLAYASTFGISPEEQVRLEKAHRFNLDEITPERLVVVDTPLALSEGAGWSYFSTPRCGG